MGRRDLPVRIDENQGAVETVRSTVGRAFYDSQVDCDAMPPRSRPPGNPIEMLRLQLHRLLGIVRKDGLLQRRVESRAVGQFQPEWIPRNQRFAEHNQMAKPCPRSLFHVGLDLEESSGALQPHWRISAPDRLLTGCGNLSFSEQVISFQTSLILADHAHSVRTPVAAACRSCSGKRENIFTHRHPQIVWKLECCTTSPACRLSMRRRWYRPTVHRRDWGCSSNKRWGIWRRLLLSTIREELSG